MLPTEESYVQRTSDLQIRDCTLADSATIAEIYNESIETGGSTMDTVKKSVGDVENMIRAFNEREIILMMERDSYTVGWGIIKRYSDRYGYRTACETSVYLRHDEVRKGYGTRMKRALIERCRQFGYHHLVAKILSVNEGSIAYNIRLGYEVVGVQKEIGYINNKWQDVTIMQLLLRDVPPL